MQTRRFTDADRPHIAQLQTESWRSAYRGQVPDSELGPALEAEIAQRWRELSFGPKEFALVAEGKAGSLDGFVTVFQRDTPFIDNLHIRPGLYRSGVGRVLMRGVADELLLLGQSSVHLTVLASNARARAFYQALGGRVTREFDYPFLGEPKPVLEIDWQDLSALSQA